MKIVTAEQMRRMDAQSAEIGFPTEILMENAGKAVAEEVVRIIDAPKERHIVVLVGPGNNGGDGLVAARYLHDWGASVTSYLCAKRAVDDPNLARIQETSDITADPDLQHLNDLLLSADCVIDAIFGTGSNRPLEGLIASVLQTVTKVKEQHPNLRIIALDLPSGMNANTGAVDLACLYVDFTITLAFPKVGLFNSPAADRIGNLRIVDIGIPVHLADAIDVELTTTGWVKNALPRRPLDANKGAFGKVVVCAGSINYIGAAYLACSSAARVGAGLVTLALAKSLQPMLAAKLTETTYLPLPETTTGIIAPKAIEVLNQNLGEYNVLLLGCGLGQSSSVIEFVSSLLFETKTPRLVLDADALNVLARTPLWWQKLPDDAILTPHPGEMARLLGVSVSDIQSNRIEVTRKAAKEWHKTVILKGAYTVIAGAEGKVMVCPVANPGLATAGTGDVLAGVIAGLLAQGLTFFEAAVAGTFIHGKAGDVVAAEFGDTGMLASDLLPVLPHIIRQTRESKSKI